MKKALYYVKFAAFILVVIFLTNFLFFDNGDGPNRSEEFGALIVQADKVTAPVPITAAVTSEGGSSDTHIFTERDVVLTEQEKQSFADNLSFGDKLDQKETIRSIDSKADIRFEWPNGAIVWWISKDERPGVLQVATWTGQGASLKHTRNDLYALSEASNRFGREWLETHSN